MPITVKRLISALETIENKLLEVEVYALESKHIMLQIHGVSKVDKKVLILTEDPKKRYK
jgi:hypothetical protein